MLKERRLTRRKVEGSVSITGQSPALSAGVPGTDGHNQVSSDISEASGEGYPLDDMLNVEWCFIRDRNLPYCRCYQLICAGRQQQPHACDLSLCSGIRGVYHSGIGAGCNLKTRDGRVNEKLSPFTSSFLRNTCPLAGLRSVGDMNCTHQRLYPCFRMSSVGQFFNNIVTVMLARRCSINDVAEPLGKFSARILRARTEPNLFVSVLRRALSFGDEFSAHSSVDRR
nr:hypothetical protein pSH11sh418-1_00002 [Shigella sonnei]